VRYAADRLLRLLLLDLRGERGQGGVRVGAVAGLEFLQLNRGGLVCDEVVLLPAVFV